MGHTSVLAAPGGPHVGPMNLVIREWLNICTPVPGFCLSCIINRNPCGDLTGQGARHQHRMHQPMSLRITRSNIRKVMSHNNGIIMSAMASQIASLTIVYSTVYSGADQRKHKSSAFLAFVRGIHRSPVNSPDKGPVTRKMISIWWRHHVIKRHMFLPFHLQPTSPHQPWSSRFLLTGWCTNQCRSLVGLEIGRLAYLDHVLVAQCWNRLSLSVSRLWYSCHNDIHPHTGHDSLEIVPRVHTYQWFRLSFRLRVNQS